MAYISAFLVYVDHCHKYSGLIFLEHIMHFLCVYRRSVTCQALVLLLGHVKYALLTILLAQ